MSNLQMNRLVESNVFLEGESLLGRCSEVKLPDVAWKEIEQKAAGLVGTVLLPGALEKFSATFKWNAIYSDVLKKLGDPRKSLRVQVYGNLAENGPEGFMDEKQVKVTLRGWFSKNAPGTFKSHENAESESTMSVNYYKLEIDGELIWEIDVLANIYITPDGDVLEKLRTNLGI